MAAAREGKVAMESSPKDSLLEELLESTTFATWQKISQAQAEKRAKEEEDSESEASFTTMPDPDEILPADQELNTSRLEEGGGFVDWDPEEVEYFNKERKDVAEKKRPTELTEEMSPKERKGRVAAWKWFGRCSRLMVLKASRTKQKYEVSKTRVEIPEPPVVKEEKAEGQDALAKEKCWLNKVCSAWVKTRLKGFEDLTE